MLVIRDNHVNSPSREIFRYSYVYMLDQHINYNASNNSVKFETLIVFCSLPLSHAARIIMLDVRVDMEKNLTICKGLMIVELAKFCEHYYCSALSLSIVHVFCLSNVLYH